MLLEKEEKFMPTEEYYKRKRDYIKKYNKSNYCSMTIMFKKDDPEQMMIYDFLRSKYSTAQYIKDLAKAAMKKEKKGE